MLRSYTAWRKFISSELHSLRMLGVPAIRLRALSSVGVTGKPAVILFCPLARIVETASSMSSGTPNARGEL